MELILMTLQIPQLRERLPTRIQKATERFRAGRMHHGVRADVAPLRERFGAHGAGEGPFARVPAFVGPEVAELREAGVAAYKGAGEGFVARVRAEVDLQVGFLEEGLGAVRVGAGVAFLGGLVVSAIVGGSGGAWCWCCGVVGVVALLLLWWWLLR